MINLFRIAHEFSKIDKFVNKNGKVWFLKKEKQKPALLTRTCPPGLVLAGPDMSKSRLLVQFRTFRVQNKVFDEISKWFCMVFAGEAQKTRYFDKKP